MNLYVTLTLAGLDAAPQVVQAERDRVLDILGVEGRQAVQDRMKIDKGGERESLQVERTPISVEVFSKDVRALVDEYGRKPGSAPPPASPSSTLYDWVLRHMQLASAASDAGDAQSAWQHLALRVAASIGRRGIAARAPFANAFQAMLPRVEELSNEAAANIATGMGSA